MEDTNLTNGEQKSKEKKKKQKKKIPEWLAWGIGVTFLSLGLTAIFSFLAEISIKDSPVYVCVIALIVLLLLNVFCDILANAIISCDPEPFYAMASNKIKGAKRAVFICKNSTKLGSIFADVIGDICGIVSGAAGTALIVFIAQEGTTLEIVFSIAINSVIGALTVGGKAIFKHFAKKYNKNITFAFAKFTTFFKREK